MPHEPMDYIRINALELDCIVGLYPRERRRRQRLHIDIALGLDLGRAGASGRIGHTADYSRVANEVCELLRFRAYRLIEEASEELAAMLLGLHPMVEQVSLVLQKPEALRGRARSASVEISRSRAELQPRRLARPFGSVAVLLQTREAGLYLLTLEPGAELPRLGDTGTRCLEWLVEGRLDGPNGIPEGPGPVLINRRTESLHNAGTNQAKMFCCACPALDGFSVLPDAR
ncbi:MAG TPA: dihydroneopterin aldolase [Polyangiaceae bacterium]